jgi:DNA polymerase-3 subunit alpha
VTCSCYAELHKHCTYSLLDGVGSPADGARRAAELGHSALAMTEHHVLSGVVAHVDACREVGIIPIVGCECYYRERRVTRAQVDAMRKNGEDVEPFFPYYHMVLIAKTIRGWRALSQLTSESYRSGFYRKPCIDDELLDRYAEDLIISTSCPSGFIPRAILRDDDAAVVRHVEKLTRWAGEDWYFEGQPHDFDDLRVLNPVLWGLSVQYGRADARRLRSLPPVARPPGRRGGRSQHWLGRRPRRAVVAGSLAQVAAGQGQRAGR